MDEYLISGAFYIDTWISSNQLLELLNYNELLDNSSMGKSAYITKHTDDLKIH